MNLPQALEIVKDHIRIGKGMELINGVPEALEMVVEELEQKKSIVERYALSARTINLYLKEFCDSSLPYDGMIADASRKASEELERLRKIELVARKLKESYGKDAQTKMNVWHEFVDALSQTQRR
ncbi:MAG: hypothetical protein WC180_06260 [Candidatus Paceibacterota bacterium]